MRSDTFNTYLLDGVTGSGKTEVYLQRVNDVLQKGKQALLLVPEIALTTQLVQRLAARFQRVAVVHSGLTDAARSLTWEAITRGAALSSSTHSMLSYTIEPMPLAVSDRPVSITSLPPAS